MKKEKVEIVFYTGGLKGAEDYALQEIDEMKKYPAE